MAKGIQGGHHDLYTLSGLYGKDHSLISWRAQKVLWMAGWRCLNCGNVLDPVMERNRLGQGKATVVSTARVPGQ